MKKNILFAILILTLFGCSNADKDISVMSFFIKERDNLDGLNSWENRKPLVVNLLKQKKPDIIGFQDMDKNQLVALSYDLQDYRYFGEGSEGEVEPGIFNPVFYLKDKFDLISRSQFWLSPTPEVIGSTGWGSDIPSIVTWVQLINRETGHIFYIFNTLFSSDVSEARNESAKLLLKKVKYIAGDAPAIISGSFYDTPQDRSYHIMTSNFATFLPFSDSESIAESIADKAPYTYNGYDDYTKITEDYIFVNGYFNVEKFFNFQIKKKDVFISNHYPIMVYLTFNDAKMESDKKVINLDEIEFN